MKWLPALALVVLIAACAPRDSAVHETSLTNEEQRAGRVAAFLVPVPKEARGVAYGFSTGVYSVSPLPDEARRRGQLRVTVGMDSAGCEGRRMRVWVGTFAACLPVSAESSARSLEGGVTGVNLWTPLYIIIPGMIKASGEPDTTSGRSRGQVAAVTFTISDGERGHPPGLPEPSSVLRSLGDETSTLSP